jgi:hypothetical protein
MIFDHKLNLGFKVDLHIKDLKNAWTPVTCRITAAFDCSCFRNAANIAFDDAGKMIIVRSQNSMKKLQGKQSAD